MRSRTFATLFSLVLGVVSHAQSAGIGAKGGALISTVKATNIRTGPIAGGVAGIYFPWGVGPRVELQPEVLISTLGSTYTEADGDHYVVRSLYFQVPMLVKLYTGNGLNFCGGYQFGKPLSVRRTMDGESTEVTDHYNDLDMGFVGGIGMDFQSGVDLSLRLYGAMTPSLRNDDALFPKNQSVQFTFGYRLKQFRGTRKGRRRG